MPWTRKNYPDSMKNFMSPVRNKAVEIANSLLTKGYEEGRAISVGIATAKEWAENRKMKIMKDRRNRAS